MLLADHRHAAGLQGNYPVVREDAAQMCALQVQAEHASTLLENEEALLQCIEKYITKQVGRQRWGLRYTLGLVVQVALIRSEKDRHMQAQQSRLPTLGGAGRDELLLLLCLLAWCAGGKHPANVGVVKCTWNAYVRGRSCCCVACLVVAPLVRGGRANHGAVL